MRSRFITSGYLSLLFSAVLGAQSVQPSAYPNSAVEKTQLGTPAGVFSLDCSALAPLLDCQPTTGNAVFTSTMNANTFWLGPTSGAPGAPTARNLSTAFPADYSANGLPFLITKLANVNVQNSAAELVLFAFAVPAGTFGTNGEVIVDVFGDMQYNNVNTDTFRMKVKMGCPDLVTVGCAGGQTMYDSGASAPVGTTSAVKPLWQMQFRFYAQGANTEYLAGTYIAGDRTAATTGVGQLGTNGGYVAARAFGNVSAGTTVSGASTMNIIVTAQWSSAQATNQWAVQGGRVVAYP